MSIAAFADKLAATPLSLAIQMEAWVIPTVQSVHILAIGAVMASSSMLNLRLAGVLARGQSIKQASSRFLPWIWWALPVLVITGTILILGEPSRELTNVFFWLKMALLVSAVAMTIVISRLAENRALHEHPASRRNAIKLVAVLSLLAWVAIVFCGRWIGYS